MGIARILAERLAANPEPSQDELNAMLRLLAKWRHGLIANTLRQRDGDTVQTGPFAGMRYPVRSAEGCEVPRLLGCYEQELAPVIESLIARGFAHVLNIGCAEGYYAVGMARRMSGAMVHAYDSNEAARNACRALAEINAVSARVSIGGLFEGRDFAAFPPGDTLVLLDIEGSEDALLDIALYPALAGLTILVECHDVMLPGLSARLAGRFAASHAVTRIEHAIGAVALPPWLAQMGHLDRLLAVWEWRSGPTPWLLLEPHV
ncbi:methyltransferase domain-containing protein [Plastoroseomonas arctica]|uniref:Uncharacterized protein n=1 Tax=Plastoroseomonas arctica TaxID=1509237 RepID=A0AAF1JXV4_9PROT|nr:class I SAM-dependent methyltransferase [Plastoroseomonas arctica]MBR0656467.1 hypothetical protein [Plastoroseomonas arctica]